MSSIYAVSVLATLNGRNRLIEIEFKNKFYFEKFGPTFKKLKQHSVPEHVISLCESSP